MYTIDVGTMFCLTSNVSLLSRASTLFCRRTRFLRPLGGLSSQWYVHNYITVVLVTCAHIYCVKIGEEVSGIVDCHPRRYGWPAVSTSIETNIYIYRQQMCTMPCILKGEMEKFLIISTIWVLYTCNTLNTEASESNEI